MVLCMLRLGCCLRVALLQPGFERCQALRQVAPAVAQPEAALLLRAGVVVLHRRGAGGVQGRRPGVRWGSSRALQGSGGGAGGG